VKIEFSYFEKFHLWFLHNRLLPGQRVDVWRNEAGQHRFPVDGDTSWLPTDTDWVCLGELRWVVDARGEYFEHHVVTL
jgi:hypothetical protein